MNLKPDLRLQCERKISRKTAEKKQNKNSCCIVINVMNVKTRIQKTCNVNAKSAGKTKIKTKTAVTQS